MPASRSARATTFTPRSWPSSPTLASNTRNGLCTLPWLLAGWYRTKSERIRMRTSRCTRAIRDGGRRCLNRYHPAMPLYPYRGKRPAIAADAWIAPTACLVGDVTVESGASVWFNATLRGDMAAIRIGPRTSVQDNVVVHTEQDGPTI